MKSKILLYSYHILTRISPQMSPENEIQSPNGGSQLEPLPQVTRGHQITCPDRYIQSLVNFPLNLKMEFQIQISVDITLRRVYLRFNVIPCREL